MTSVSLELVARPTGIVGGVYHLYVLYTERDENGNIVEQVSLSGGPSYISLIGDTGSVGRAIDPPPIKESSFKVRAAIEIGLKNRGGLYDEEELYAGANHIQTARG